MSLRTKIKLQNDEGVRTYEQSQKRGLGRLFAGGLAVGASLITRDLAKTTTGKVAEVVCSATAGGLLGYVFLDTAASCVTFPVALTKFNKKKSVAGAYFRNYDNSTGWSITTDEAGNEVRQYNPEKDNRIFLYSTNPDDQERAYRYLKADNKIKGYREAFKDEHAGLLKRIYVDYVDESDEGTFAACRRALAEAGVTDEVVEIIRADVAKNGIVTRKSMKHLEDGALSVLDKIACWDFCQELQKNAKNEYSKFESLDHLRGSLYLTPEQIKFFDQKKGKLPSGRFFGINKFPFTEEQYKLLVTYKGGTIKDLERIEVLRRRINEEQNKANPNAEVVATAVAEIDDIQKRILDNARVHRKRLRVPFTNSGSTPFAVGKRYRVLNGTIGERLQSRKARRKAAKKTTEALEASFSNNIFPITKVLSRPLAGAINYAQKRIRYGKLYSKHQKIFGHNGFEARHKGMHAADVWCDTSHRFDKIEKKYMKRGLTDIVEENNQGNISNMAVGYVKESAKAKLSGMTNGIISSIASVKERAEKRTDPTRHGTTTYLDNPVMVQIYLDSDATDKKVLPSATLNIDHDDVLEGAIQGLIEDVKNGNIKASEINNITFMAGDRKVVIYREQLGQVWEDAKKGVPFKQSRLAKSIAQICTKEKFPKVIDFEAYEAWESGAENTASTDASASADAPKPTPVNPEAGLGMVAPSAGVDGNDTTAPVATHDATAQNTPVVEPAITPVADGSAEGVRPLEAPVADGEVAEEPADTAIYAELNKALEDLDAEYDRRRDEILSRRGTDRGAISQALIDLNRERMAAREALADEFAGRARSELVKPTPVVDESTEVTRATETGLVGGVQTAIIEGTNIREDLEKALKELDSKYDARRNEIWNTSGLSSTELLQALDKVEKERAIAKEALINNYAGIVIATGEDKTTPATNDGIANPQPKHITREDIVKPVTDDGDAQLEIDIDGVLRKQAQDTGANDEVAESTAKKPTTKETPKRTGLKPTAVMNQPKPELPSSEVKETTREMMARTGISTKPAPAKYNRMAVDINKSRNNLYAKIEKLNEDYDAAMELLHEARESGKASDILSAKEDALEVVRELKTSYITLYNLYQANKTSADKEAIRDIDDNIADLSDDFNRLLAIDVPESEEEINETANSSIDAEIAKIEEDLQSANELLTNATGDEKLELLKEKAHYLTMLTSLYETKSDYISDADRATAKVGATRKKYESELKVVKAEIKAIEDSKKEIAMERPADMDDRKVAFIERMAGKPIGKISPETKKTDVPVTTSNAKVAKKPVAYVFGQRTEAEEEKSATSTNTTPSKPKAKKPATFVFGARVDDEETKPVKTTGSVITTDGGKKTTTKKPTTTDGTTTTQPGGKKVTTTVIPPVKTTSASAPFDRLEKRKEAIRKKCERISKRITSMEVSISKLEVINSEVQANNRYAFTISERERKISGAQVEIEGATSFMQEAQALIDRIKGKTFDELTEEERKAEEAAFEVAKKTSKAMTGVNRETINDKKEIQSAISESKQLGIKPKKSKPTNPTAPDSV